MINDVTKEIFKRFDSELFVETGLFRAQTAVIVRSWFRKLKIIEIEINPEYCNYGEELFKYDENMSIYQSDSKIFLRDKIDIFEKYNSPVFYLDAHWDPNQWPLRDEIKYISALRNPIIIIDDFKTPGPDGKPSPDHGYDSYNGQDCDTEYILDLIKPKTDCVFYAKEPTIDGQGCGIVFINRKHKELKEKLSGIDLIMERI